MNCARDRMLMILATRTLDVQAAKPEDRVGLIDHYITAWREALSREYAGEGIRVTTERVTRETRRVRNDRISEALKRGESNSAIASREHVSTGLVKLIKRGQKPA